MRHRRFVRPVLLLAMAVPLAACGGDDPTEPDEEVLEIMCGPDLDPALSAPGRDGDWLRIAEEKPGFAGLVSRNGLEISVASGYDMDAESYRAAIQQWSPSSLRAGPLHTREVEHTWIDLVLAHNAWAACVFSLESFDGADVDEDRNRVVFGVRDEPTARGLREVLPEGLFVVEVTEEVVGG